MNFSWGKYFTGWDAINPEYNFSLNFQRSLSAFWQENYGLGTIGGHGFAALLPHTAVTYLFSVIFPQWAIRTIFTFFSFYLGSVGMFFLVRFIIQKLRDDKKLNYFLQDILEKNQEYLALAASLFYILNLGTTQTFYVQLEPFIVQFAALPWLFWIIIRLLDNWNKKNLLLFFFINFLATIQGFIPSLFVAYATALSIFIIMTAFFHRKSPIYLKNISLIAILTLIINLYWIIPLGHYVLTQNQSFLSAYNNLQSTPNFVEVSKKYGNLPNVALLKSYLFDSVQFNIPVLKPWINHLNNPLTVFIGYIFFLIVVGGAVFSFYFFRQYLPKILAIIFIFFFGNIAISTPPFSFVINILQSLSPTFEQAFRNTFTKFSIGLAFEYSIFFSFGLIFLLFFKKKYLRFNWNNKYFFTIIICSLIFYSFPVFTGNLIYKNLLLKIPQAYFDIFDYFKTQTDGRIADFPQDCPEGWYSYSWGYIGSGFQWYGVKQPFASRTFDVWSNNNENYFWQINQAISEKNYALVDSVFNKYNIRWIYYDPNIKHCRDQKAFLQYDNFIQYLSLSNKYTLVKTFPSDNIASIKLFENKYFSDNSSYAGAINNLANIGPFYKWNDDDRAFFERDDYMTTENKDYDIYYPFRSLFTKRSSEEKEYSLKTLNNWIIFSNTIPKNVQNYIFKTKNYNDIEKKLPFFLKLTKVDNTTYEIFLSYIFPQLFIDGKKLLNYQPSYKLGTFRTDEFKVMINNLEAEGDDGLYKDYFTLNTSNKIEIINSSSAPIFSWDSESDILYKNIISKNFTLNIPSFENGYLEVITPKISDKKLNGYEVYSELDSNLPQPCEKNTLNKNLSYEIGKEQGINFVRLISKKFNQCLIYNLDQVSAANSYLLEIISRNISGANPLFYIFNRKGERYLDLNINNNSLFKNHSYIIPAVAEGELGYYLHFVNKAGIKQQTINDFGGFGLWQIPYEFIKTIKFQNKVTNNLTINNDIINLDVSHPNSTVYSFNIPETEINYIVLFQGFHPSWKAYVLPLSQLTFLDSFLPFIKGAELKNHVLINNWANGWKLDSPSNINSQTSVVVIFWPQYLEFIGFGILIVSFAVILIRSKSKTLPDGRQV